MSRSADKSFMYDAAQATKIHDALVSILPLTTQIEILPSWIPPPAGSHYLFEAGNLGIPKRSLITAFIFAVQILHAHISAPIHRDIPQAVLDATSIIAIHDPEHLTALNTRKRYILALTQPSTEAVCAEWKLMHTILTSPLHRQTKSPTLWHHRFFLVCEGFLPAGYTLLDDFGVVLKAAERHANNYYAFNYARKVILPAIECADEPLSHDVGPGVRNIVETAGCKEQSMLRTVAEMMLGFTLSHPADTAGWSFLASLLRCTTTAEESVPIEKRQKSEDEGNIPMGEPQNGSIEAKENISIEQQAGTVSWKQDVLAKVRSTQRKWGWSGDAVMSFLKGFEST